MKILLLGASGQLGQVLSHTLTLEGDVKACARDVVDLMDHNSIMAALDTVQPDIIVNAAAYTTVDKAESERDLAFQVNADAVNLMAQEATKRNIWFIHYSTDYVFDGQKNAPYLETDITNPINVYGASKLAGEQAITASKCKHLIFRTTWVIGQHGHNFARTILKLAQKHDTLNVIDDQIGVPTTPVLIAKVTQDAIKAISASNPWPSGIYHLTPRGKTSWFGIAQTLLQLGREKELSLALDENSLSTIKTTEYPTPAKRPLNSLLDTAKLEKNLTFKLPQWKDDFILVVDAIIEELKSI